MARRSARDEPQVGAMIEDYSAHYRELHKSEKKFPGFSIKAALPQIVMLVSGTKPRSILDYGCGKGRQYSEQNIHQQWGGMLPWLYDVGVPAFMERPAGAFDAVICTDVMEHIAEPDVDAILGDIFSFLPRRDDGGISFAAFWIACRPAKRKTLADGRNVHLTVQPEQWWQRRLDAFKRPGLIINAGFDHED